MYLRRSVFALFFAVLFGCSVFAQQETATLTGEVKDAAGAIVPGVVFFEAQQGVGGDPPLVAAPTHCLAGYGATVPFAGTGSFKVA